MQEKKPHINGFFQKFQKKCIFFAFSLKFFLQNFKNHEIILKLVIPIYTFLKEMQMGMLRKFLEGNIHIVDSVKDWEDAVAVSSLPLLEKNYIEQCYIDKIIQNIKELGPYVLLTDGVMMPHARPEDGVLKKGMSFLKIRSGVKLHQTDEPVYLSFTLAAENSDGHQDAIMELADFLDNEENINKLFHENLTEKEIYNLF